MATYSECPRYPPKGSINQDPFSPNYGKVQSRFDMPKAPLGDPHGPRQFKVYPPGCKPLHGRPTPRIQPVAFPKRNVTPNYVLYSSDSESETRSSVDLSPRRSGHSSETSMSVHMASLTVKARELLAKVNKIQSRLDAYEGTLDYWTAWSVKLINMISHRAYGPLNRSNAEFAALNKDIDELIHDVSVAHHFLEWYKKLQTELDKLKLLLDAEMEVEMKKEKEKTEGGEEEEA